MLFFNRRRRGPTWPDSRRSTGLSQHGAYLLTADTAEDSVIPGSARDGFLGDYPRPAARVVALDDLDAALPEGTAWVAPAQRRHGFDERLRQVTRLQRS
jgi:hypothetical protein